MPPIRERTRRYAMTETTSTVPTYVYGTCIGERGVMSRSPRLPEAHAMSFPTTRRRTWADYHSRTPGEQQ
ncbi:hypothetical protein [Promicromonospora sp. NPDC050249]|uniref:hypothetical protein n=1 Tax=Promicromonospora sp. NPDC050249 TaxID=3154743 RepID=UPI0033D98909